MEHYVITEHSKRCSTTKIVGWTGLTERAMCHSHDTIFYHDGQFILVTYNRCLYSGYSDPEMMEKILRDVLGSKSVKYMTTNRIQLKKELNKMISEDLVMRRSKREINYIYEDAARKKYCIVTSQKYIDSVISRIDLHEEYYKMIDYLKEHNRYLIPQVEELYRENKPYDYIENKTVLNTIDELIKKMKNGSNN